MIIQATFINTDFMLLLHVTACVILKQKTSEVRTYEKKTR